MTRWTTLVLMAGAAFGQTSGFSINLSGTGSGSGIPGDIAAHLSHGTFTVNGSGGTSTTIPVSFVGIGGNGAGTDIIIVPSGNNNDVLHFHGSAVSLNNLGRSGMASVDYGTGAFHNATGTLSYNLVCTLICFDGNGTPVSDIFAFNFTSTGTLSLPTAVAKTILPSLFPPPPSAPGVIDTLSSIYTFFTNPQSALGGGNFRHADASASGGGGESFTMALPWQTAASTYSATATCPGLTSCWLTVPAGSGTIAPFTTDSIALNLNQGSLATGTYPANFSLSVTPSGGTPVTENIPFTLVVTNGAPLLQLSETGIQFQTVVGAAQAPAAHTISLITSGSAISYTAAASTLTGGNWLTVSPAVGSASSSANGSIHIAVNPSGLAAGSYFGRVDVSAPGALSPVQSVEVELTVAASGNAVPTLSTTGVIFATAQDSTPSSQVVTVSSSATTPFAVAGQAAADNLATWLDGVASATTLSATQPISETLSVNVKGLTPGVYTGTFYESVSATDAAYPGTVLLIVTPPTGTACTPTELLPVFTSLASGFTFAAGLPVSVQAQVVDDCGNPLKTGLVQVSPSTGDAPVTLVPMGNGQWSGTWAPHGLAGGAASVAISAESASGLTGAASVAGTLSANNTATVVTPGGIVNAASLVSGVPVAPGEFLSIFGSNLAASTVLAPSYPYPASLGGTQVLLNGQALPLEFVSAGQINALVPYETPVNGFQELIISQNGTYSLPETVVVAPANPAVFTQSQSGQGAGAIIVVKANGTQFVASASQPASPGDVLAIYCSGLGAVNPAVADGAASSLSTLSTTVSPVTVTIGGQPAQVLFAGLAPGFAGLYQVNAVVPAGIAAGSNVQVILTEAGTSSPVVTVAIQ